MRALRTIAVCWLVSTGPLLAQDLGSEQQREQGKLLYDKYCAQCHGDGGAGDGYAAGRVKPEPRDFTSGKYKFRSTPSGMLPTDDDIRRVIEIGLPYTSMPGWPNLSDGEIQNIIYHLKSFSEDFNDPSKYAEPIDVPAAPPITDESIERGRSVYENQGCAACHGSLGRGDGLSAPTMTDDWGDHIRPADMSQPWTFRGGPTREDMFRTFSTGLNGTPMPSYFDSLAVEDRWDLVNYMVSLGDGEQPGYAEHVIASYVEDEIDLAQGIELFANAPKARFPLMGQIVEPGRSFFPLTSSVEVQSVYNRKEIAIVVRWHDMRAETRGMNSPSLEVPFWDEDNPGAAGQGSDGEGEGDDFWGEEEAAEGDDFWGEEAAGEGDDFWGEEEGDAGGGGALSEFSDAVALQFPSKLPSGIRKPYFIFGDTQSSVDLWFVDLALPRFVQQFVGRGSDGVEPARVDEFETVSGYDNGEWFVIFKRELRSAKNVSFQQAQFVPIAFSVWDGFDRERGNKRALSAWFYLYPEPQQQVSAVGPMIRAGLVAFFVELLVVFWIRKRFATETPPSSDGAVLQQRLAG